MAAVGESVSNNKRKGDGQRKFQEEAGKTKKKKYNCKHKKLGRKIILSCAEAMKWMNTLNAVA